MKRRIKRGDEIVVISGDSRGHRGKVLEVLPRKNRILVEGVNKVKRHLKKGADQNAQDGGIVNREAPIHVSNAMLAERYEARQARSGEKVG